MGADMPVEQALLQRLQSMLPTSCLSAQTIASCDDLSVCDLLVVLGDSATSRVGVRRAQPRPELAFWSLDSDGTFRDGRNASQAELRDEQIVRVLTKVRESALRTEDPSLPGLVPSIIKTREPLVSHAVERYDNTRPIAQLLHDGVASAQGLVTLMRNGRPQLFLDFDRRLVAPAEGADKDIAASLAQDFCQLQLEPLLLRDFDTSVSSPLAPLLWNIAQLIGNSEVLLEPMNRHTILSLKQWPDFRVLAHRNDHFRLCCLLLKRPGTAVEAANLLQLDEATVHGFFNAAYLSGIAEVSQSVSTHSSASSNMGDGSSRRSAGSTLARMWRSVRLSMQGGA